VNPVFITHFHKILPKNASTQQSSFDWIAAAHTQSEALKAGVPVDSNEMQRFKEWVTTELYRVGCKPGAINYRHHEINDFNHVDWNDMQIYRLHEKSEGVGLQVRQKVHSDITDLLFEKFYPETVSSPDHIIHVSCTGYTSPSCAQKLVAKREWGNKTSVTNAYHMGCYGAIPAIRIASAFSQQCQGRSDIVHTELCSLHMNPSDHQLDQLVGQSLFADGFIKYSVMSGKENITNPSLRILSMHIQILPDSHDAMEWLLMDWGFYFFLSNKIPVILAKHLKNFTAHLCGLAGVDEKEIMQHGIYAIHPGGPKILEYAQRIFEIEPERLFLSKRILQNHGNISSATLPHIWEAVCAEDAIPNGTKVLSLAFGPGLTIAGILLEKVGGSQCG
jgi:predicted naringenin-chalcone synthase